MEVLIQNKTQKLPKHNSQVWCKWIPLRGMVIKNFYRNKKIIQDLLWNKNKWWNPLVNIFETLFLHLIYSFLVFVSSGGILQINHG